MPLSKHNRYVIESKAGRVAVWILAVLLLAFGTALLVFELMSAWLDCVDCDPVRVESLVLGGLAVLFGILDIAFLIRNKKRLAEIEEE